VCFTIDACSLAGQVTATALNTTQLSGHRHARLGSERHKGGCGAKAKQEDGQGFEDHHALGWLLAKKLTKSKLARNRAWGSRAHACALALDYMYNSKCSMSDPLARKGRRA